MVDNRTASGLHGGEAKDWWRGARTEDIEALAHEYGFTVRKLTPYQIRVEGKVDFYVTNGRVHILPINKRRDYHTYEDVWRIFEQIRAGNFR